MSNYIKFNKDPTYNPSIIWHCNLSHLYLFNKVQGSYNVWYHFFLQTRSFIFICFWTWFLFTYFFHMCFCLTTTIVIFAFKSRFICHNQMSSVKVLVFINLWRNLMFLGIMKPRAKKKKIQVYIFLLLTLRRFVEKLPKLSIKRHRKKLFVKFGPQGGKCLCYRICNAIYTSFWQYRTQSRQQKFKFRENCFTMEVSDL